jgi:hypothetical protein
MEIEIKQSSNASLIAVFCVIIFFIVIIGIILLNVQSDKHQTQLQTTYDKGYIQGYIKGKEDGGMQVLELQKELKQNINENKTNW